MRKYWLLAFLALCLVGVNPLIAHAKDDSVKVASNEPSRVTQPDAQQDMVSAMERMLERQNVALRNFVHSQLMAGNRTLINSRSNMQFSELPDGSYRAWFRAYDLNTVTCSVMADNDKTTPYIGTATYMEREYEAIVASKNACNSATFRPVQGKDQPYRKFFQCYKGQWR